MSQLSFQLPVGYQFGTSYLRNVELLRTNGVAEKVFVQKLPERAYTWMGYVISIGVKSIEGIEVGIKCREEYARTTGVTIPPVILQMPLADANTCILEIHRRTWENLLKQQDNQCKVCGKVMKMDVDLNRVDYPAEDKEHMGQEYKELVANLPIGFKYIPLGLGERKLFPEYEGMTFNKLVFRVPTLADAIRHEVISDDSILFWRKIAYDCLLRMESSEGGILDEGAKTAFGMKLFDEMFERKDLLEIRNLLRETLPTLPFWYEEECPCPNKRLIPVSISANSFFSE